MTNSLQLPERYRLEIETLLKRHVPGVDVWAYGSRVNGLCHDGSDLDLVLRAPGLTPISTHALRALKDSLRDSNAPILVEARDWARLPVHFQREIEREYVELVSH